MFQRGSNYFKHYCSGGSKYFDIFGLGGTNIGVQFFATDHHRPAHQVLNNRIVGLASQ